MNKSVIAGVMFLVLSHVAITFAQSSAAAAEYPGGPPVAARAPEFSSWIVTCAYTGVPPETELDAGYNAAIDRMTKASPDMARVFAANPGSAHRKPHTKEISAVRTGKIKCETTVYTSGQASTRWLTDEGIISQDAFTKKINLQAIGANDEPEFLELSWVSKESFAGFQTVNDKKCLVYRAKIERLRIDSPLLYQRFGSEISSETVTATLLVDPDTRLPINLQFAEQTRKYEFRPPPANVLTLPPEFAAVLQAAQKQVQSTSIRISQP